MLGSFFVISGCVLTREEFYLSFYEKHFIASLETVMTHFQIGTVLKLVMVLNFIS